VPAAVSVQHSTPASDKSASDIHSQLLVSNQLTDSGRLARRQRHNAATRRDLSSSRNTAIPSGASGYNLHSRSKFTNLFVADIVVTCR